MSKTNIHQFIELLSMSCIASFEEWSNIFCNRSSRLHWLTLPRMMVLCSSWTRPLRPTVALRRAGSCWCRSWRSQNSSPQVSARARTGWPLQAESWCSRLCEDAEATDAPLDCSSRRSPSAPAWSASAPHCFPCAWLGRLALAKSCSRVGQNLPRTPCLFSHRWLRWCRDEQVAPRRSKCTRSVEVRQHTPVQARWPSIGFAALPSKPGCGGRAHH